MTSILYRIGRGIFNIFRALGAWALLTLRLLRCAFTLERTDLVRRLFAFGSESFPLVAVTALLVGAILVLQAKLFVGRFGAQTLVGWMIGYGVLRQVGPVFVALVFSGRCGSRNAAELASMTTREQIAGLVAVGVDPLPAVVAPRAAAMVIALIAFTAIGDAVALGGGAIAARLLMGIDFDVFWRSLITACKIGDLASNLTKALVFGGAAATLSAQAGLAAHGGAAAVGEAATRSVVRSALAFVALDLLLSPLY